MRHRALSRTARVATVGLALLVVAATSACNPGRPPAATVGGTDISAARVDQMLEAFVEGAPDIYRSAIQGQGDDTTQMGAASAILNSLVLQVLQAQLAEDAGVVPGADDIDEATRLVQASFVSGAAQPDDPAPAEGAAAALEQSTAIFDAMPADLQDWLVDLRATTLAFSDSLATEDEAREVYDADPSAYDLLCLRAIIAEPDGVDAVQQRLDAGDDFGAVSTDLTIDPQLAAAGGELGQCLTLDQMVQAGLSQAVVDIIATLDDTGDLTGPVDLGDGYAYWFELQERQQRAFDDVAEEIQQGLTGGGDAALQQRVQDALADVDVRVDPRFGTWDAETGSITPPEGSRVPGPMAVEDPFAPTGG